MLETELFAFLRGKSCASKDGRYYYPIGIVALVLLPATAPRWWFSGSRSMRSS